MVYYDRLGNDEGEGPSALRGSRRAGFRCITVRPRCPGSGRILLHGSQEDPAQRGSLSRGTGARRPLEIAGEAAQQVDAGQPGARARPPAANGFPTPETFRGSSRVLLDQHRDVFSLDIYYIISYITNGNNINRMS